LHRNRRSKRHIETRIVAWKHSTSRRLHCDPTQEPQTEEIFKLCTTEILIQQFLLPTPKCSPPRQYSFSPFSLSPSRKTHKQQTGPSYHSHPFSQHVPPTAALSTMSKANAHLPTSQPLTQIVSVPTLDLHPSTTPAQVASLKFVLGLDLVQQRQICRPSRRGMIATVQRIKGQLVPQLEADRQPHLQIQVNQRVLELHGEPPSLSRI
jgi:hypothetical protein